MTGSYAVLWREGKGPIYAGKVELSARGLKFEGSCHDRLRASRAIGYEDLAGLSLTRAPQERIYGKLTLMLELREGGVVEIASVNGFGVVRELEERIAGLAPLVPVD
jgi:hypothetical protein